MTPLQPEETSFLTTLLLKIAGIFITFISGVVTATWVVAGKINGFDSRMRNLEKVQDGCPAKTLINMDAKLDRIHERIDEILLKGRYHDND